MANPKKYSSSKTNIVSTLFERKKKYSQEIQHLQNDVDLLKREIKKEKKRGNLTENLRKELLKTNRHLLKKQAQYTEFKKTITKLATILGFSIALITTPIVSYSVNNHSNEIFNNNLQSAYSIVQENEEDTSSSASFLEYKEDLYRYIELIELSNSEDLSSTEKKELANLKNKILSSPEETTQLSLEILKTKIADKLGIDDYSRITIYDNSTDVSASQYHSHNGTIIDLSIYIDGKEAYARDGFFYLSTGEIILESDEIPQEILEVISDISEAQNSKDSKKAMKALKSSVSLDMKEFNLEPYNSLASSQKTLDKEK